MAYNTALSGPKMKQRLQAAGIDPQQVVQRRENGYYVAEFYNRRMESPVPSSKEWAQAIADRLADLTIIDQHDTVADWREGKPVIWASVTFALKP